MDCDSIRAIEQCFCDAYNFDCRNCPMSKYKISENLAVCYYGDDPYNSTEKQVNQFLAVARGHWKHEWDGRLNNSMRKILRLKARESRKIANSYDAVCVEDINLQDMAQTLNFGKAVGDNGFGMFRNFLKYKLEEQGKYYIVIDKWFPSSKTCRHCGNINHELQLGQMEWICPNCGEKIDRDVNAAINIRDEGLRMFYAA